MNPGHTWVLPRPQIPGPHSPGRSISNTCAAPPPHSSSPSPFLGSFCPHEFGVTAQHVPADVGGQHLQERAAASREGVGDSEARARGAQAPHPWTGWPHAPLLLCLCQRLFTTGPGSTKAWSPSPQVPASLTWPQLSAAHKPLLSRTNRPALPISSRL